MASVTTAEAFLDTYTIEDMQPSTRVKVYVRVARGEVPVLGASVTMTVTRPTGAPLRVDMLDNGSGKLTG